MPKDSVRYSDGFASGTASRIAGGTAMYEALAPSTATKVAPPGPNPSMPWPMPRPIAPPTRGMTTPKAARRHPTRQKSSSRFTASMPSSSRNKHSAPVKIVW